MLNVGQITEGFVLDHIKAGKSMTIYHDLGLDKLDCTVAIIKNARSNKMGKKDITVNIIQNGEIVDKKKLKLPPEIVNVIQCKNPRCITSIEHGLDQIFVLTDEEREIYRCKYCEGKYKKYK